MKTVDDSQPELKPSVPTEALPDGLLRHVRRAIVFVIGMTVLLIGIAMILLPGPATIVIPIGLGILATEFIWARRWLNYVKHHATEMTNSLLARTTPTTAEDDDREKSAPTSTRDR